MPGSLSDIDSAAAYAIAKKIDPRTAKGDLTAAINRYLIKSGDESNFDVISDNFDKCLRLQ